MKTLQADLKWLPSLRMKFMQVSFMTFNKLIILGVLNLIAQKPLQISTFKRAKVKQFPTS